jgi:hypothetical protein
MLEKIMGEPRRPTVMRFKLALERPLDAFNIFYPKGHQVLNRTEWRGKEPRSCAVTGIRGGPHSAADIGPIIFDVEVSYRPKGYITFVGETKYDGWTAMMLDRQKDGTLLDGHGKPLPPGQPQVYLPFEVYKDAEFNDMNFGDFVDEVQVAGIRHVSHDEVMRRFHNSQHMSMSMRSDFIAPRRQRPQAKIIVSEFQFAAVGERSDMRSIHVDKTAPHFTQTLFDRLYEIASLQSEYADRRRYRVRRVLRLHHGIEGQTGGAAIGIGVQRLLILCLFRRHGGTRQATHGSL